MIHGSRRRRAVLFSGVVEAGSGLPKPRGARAQYPAYAPYRARLPDPGQPPENALSFECRRLCVGLLVMLAGSPAAAQPANEVVVGGGFHAGFELGDFVSMSSVPSVDARIVRWTGEKWGVAGRVMVGLGAGRPDEPGIVERRYPTYYQIHLRYRTQEPGGGSSHFGFGGGVMTFSETLDRGDGPREEFHLWLHLLAVEALRWIPLGERLNLKIGVTALLPVHVQPVALLAWRF